MSVRQLTTVDAQNIPPWKRSDRWLAALLGWLVPGLGHTYQRRWFKAIIYATCILGTFFGGLRMGEGAVVYNLPQNSWGISLQYLAQLCIGLPALPGLYQARRAQALDNRSQHMLSQPLSAPFEGYLMAEGRVEPVGQLVGRVELHTERIQNTTLNRGRFIGSLDGKQIELELSGGMTLGPELGATRRRSLECHVKWQPDQHPDVSYVIKGHVPRPWWNAYAVPPDPATLQDLHRRLGKYYDLALAFTMIAGLLNVLAIWDALEGPAYEEGGVNEEVHT